MEVSIPESKIGRKKMAPGDAIRVKGELDDNQRFKIFLLENRASKSRWDVFLETIGVIYYVNQENRLLHFIVDSKIDGVVHFSNVIDNFSSKGTLLL